MDTINTSQENPQPVQPGTDRGLKIALVTAALVLLVCGGVFVAFMAGRKGPSGGSNNPSVSTTQDFSSTTTTFQSGSESDNRSCSDSGVNSRPLSGDIVWHNPQPFEGDPEIFRVTLPGETEDTGIAGVKWLRLGQGEKGDFAGYSIVLAEVSYSGPAFYPGHFRFAVSGDSYVLLQKHSDEIYDRKFPANVLIDTRSVIADLDYPDSIVISGSNGAYRGKLDKFFNGWFCADDKRKFSSEDSELGEVFFASYDINANDEVDGIVPNEYFSQGNAFVFRAPDGTTRVYEPVLPFVGEDRILQATWSDGTVNSNEYDQTDVGGCGSRNYLSIISPDRLNPSKELIEVGKASNGDPLYEIGNPRHPILRNIYDNQYSPFDQPKIAYEVFVASRPVVIWIDPLGRMVKLQKKEFMPMAECGKPVIYLYPTVATKVNVQVDPRGGFSVTEPQYGPDGWNVFARPDGRLQESATGREYPYLFWEGRGGFYQPPVQGWSVPAGEVAEFLSARLSEYNLNEKETADFLEFWLPKMSAAPYYFISFYDNRVMDQLAPLAVTPHPDTIIRILMDFRPLSEPIESEPPLITMPERRGFTLVEWGGVLR